jgi:UDP-N-acetylmuramoylalanine--D-glutamate ligase
VIGLDSGTADRPGLREAAGRLSELGVETHLDASGEALAARAGTLVKSPGVPRSAPAVQAALRRGIPVIGELELAWRLLPGEFIAVTGTNGKTTTTEWIGHIHRTASAPVAVAGNVGTALSSLVGTVDPEATIVAECSSFQLEDADAFAPEAAVLLNLAPDHLDRHGSFEAYTAAKLRIFARQGNDDIAVAPTGLGIEDLGGCARRVCFGGDGAELSDRAGHLWWDEQPLIAHEEIALPGKHNRQNAMAAAAACLARGLSPEDVADGLRTFSGVAHRLEPVATRNGVAYVNDSKATNVASTLVALAAFPAGSTHLILGGQGKGQDFTPLADPVRRRCRAVYLIGEDAAAIATALGGAAEGPPLIASGTLERALTAARACARSGETVLLSPACASFDQFADFEARGEAFRALVTGGGDGH